MNDAQRDRIIAARDAWRDTHRAYNDQVAKHWAWLMEGGPPPERDPELLTPEALQELTRLREAEGAALAAYRDVGGT